MWWRGRRWSVAGVWGKAGLLLMCLATQAAGMGIQTVGNVETVGQGWVNWEASVVKARGFGVAPRDAISAPQARLLARRAAIVDGYRMLLEIGTVVVRRSETVMVRYAIEVDTVLAGVEGVIRGAQIIDEREHGDGRYEVVLQVPVHGVNGLSSVLLPRVLAPQQPGAVFPSPAPAVPAPATPTVPWPQTGPPWPAPTLPPQVSAAAGHTGLVVVVRGLGAQRSMTPRLVTVSGEVVYGQWSPGQVDPDFALRHGVAGFPRAVDLSRRGGARPLVVHAISVRGAARTDIVISDEDAARIRQANQAGRFLDRFLVDIVIE
ncbi:MAG: LPP20 family lipoprotein [Armatimonadetes bacterium]|nr:LPP20 family lipoprotein [Armatimonadota bacterium]